MYGPTPDQPRTPTVAFQVRGHESTAGAIQRAEGAGLVLNGELYAATVIEKRGNGAEGIVCAACAA